MAEAHVKTVMKERKRTKPDPMINRKDDLVPTTKVVKIQEEVMEEDEVRDILEEMGFEFPAPSPRCFFHPKKGLEKKTSQARFNYRRCPLKECPVFISEDHLKDYYACAHDSEKLLAVYYVLLRKNLLKCRCRQPMQLYLSYSDMNPKRLYFRFQRNRCKVFQWTDEMPTDRNQELWNPNFVDFNDPLWEDICAHNQFQTTQDSNKIKFPLEVRGTKYRAEDREDLLRIVYMIRQLRHKQEI